MFSSLWNWGLGKQEESSENQAREPPSSPTHQKGFLNSIVSGVFGEDFLQVIEFYYILDI